MHSEHGRTTGNGHRENGLTRLSAMPVQQPPAAVEQRKAGPLVQAVRIARKRNWLILAVTALVTAAVAAATLAQTKSYDATATLVFRNPSTLVDGQLAAAADPGREAATDGQLVRLTGVAAVASRRLGGQPSPTQIEDMVSVGTGQGDTAQVTASASSPKLAADVANAYGQAYIDFRQVAEQQRIRRTIGEVQRGLAALPAAQRSGGVGDRLRAEVQTLQLLANVQGAGAEVVQPATPPTGPTRHVVRNVLFGLLGGFLLGCLLALVLEQFDRRVKSTDELEEVYGLPVLARIPRSRSLGKRGRQNRLQMMADALTHSQEAEAFRTLRANLRYFNVDRGLRSLLVVSPSAGDGKSTVTAFMAIAMAAMGDRVVLVEADLRKSGSDTPLTDSGGDGLSLVLAGFDLDDALTEIPVCVDALSDEPRTLTRLAHGPLPPNPSELLESDRMRWVIRELEQRYDMVIIDSPALATVSDALALVPQVSGVLIVSGLNNTRSHAAANLRKQLSLVGGHAVGVVANYASSEADEYYYGSAYTRSSRAGAR